MAFRTGRLEQHYPESVIDSVFHIYLRVCLTNATEVHHFVVAWSLPGQRHSQDTGFASVPPWSTHVRECAVFMANTMASLWSTHSWRAIMVADTSHKNQGGDPRALAWLVDLAC